MEQKRYRKMVDSNNEIQIIFDECEGQREVFLQRVHDFLQRYVGNPETFFKQITNVLRQALKRASMNIDLCEMLLRMLVKISNDDAAVFIDEKTPGLIPFLIYAYKVLEKVIALYGTDAEESKLTSTIVNILDIITAISDVNDEDFECNMVCVDGKSAVAMFVHPCFNLITDEKRTMEVRLEATKFLNNVIESFMRGNTELGIVEFVENFDFFLVKAGDLELQLCMTELICRMLQSYDKRYSHALKWFSDNLDSRNDFLAIRDDEFELDCRKFINNLNERQLKNRSVYSILCKQVFLGSYKVNCPIDENGGLFWTDFNLGSKSISFFAIDTQNDNTWETVTIKKSIISQTKIVEKKESHAVVLSIHLNQSVRNLLSFCHLSGKIVKFVYDENHSPVTAANLLFPKDVAPIPPPSPEDVIPSTPKASVTSNAVHLSSRAKGLSITVSLSTPRRRRSDGKSSDDSSKPNDLVPGIDKQNEKSVSNEQEISRRNVRDDTSKVENPTAPDEKKRTGKLSTKTDEPPDLAESDGNACSKDTRRKTEKVKASTSVPAVKIESGSDGGSRVRTRSLRGNDSDNSDASVTRTKPGEEQRGQSLKPRVDESVTDQEITQIEETQNTPSAEERVEIKLEGRRSRRKSVDKSSEIESEKGNGMDITCEPKKDMDNRRNGASIMDCKSVDSGLGKSLDKQDLTADDTKGHDGCFVEMSQDEPTVINETQIRSEGGEEHDTTLDDVFVDDQDEDLLCGIALPSVAEDDPKDGKKPDDEGGRSSEPFQKPIVAVKTTKIKKRDMDENVGDIVTAFEIAFPKVPAQTVKGKITKGKEDNVEEDGAESSTAFQKKTTRNVKGRMTKEKKDDVEEGEISTGFERKTSETAKRKLIMEKKDDEGDERKTTRTVKGKTRQPRTRAAARRDALIGRGVSTSESEFPKEERPRTRAKSARPSVSVSKVFTISSGDSLDKKNKLGTGYNTEDWMLGTSEPERRIDKKKALKYIADKAGKSCGSQSRRSLVNSVFRESYKSGSMKKKQKLRGPFEFKCNSPVKRTPQSKRILCPIKRAYQKKKDAEIRGKSKNVTRPNESTKDKKDSKQSFSDVALEVEEKHRARERMRHSEGEIRNSSGDARLIGRTLSDLFRDGKGKPGKTTRKNFESVDNMEEKEQNEEIEKGAEETSLDEHEPGDFHDTSVVEVDDTPQFHFDESPVDKTTEMEQKSLANHLLKEYLDDNSLGDQESFDNRTAGGHDQLDEDAEGDKDEMSNDEREKRVMENLADDNDENHRKALKGTKPRMNSDAENTAKKSTRGITPGTDRARGKQDNDDVLGEGCDEGDDDEGNLVSDAKQNQRKKKQAESATAQRTRSSSVGNARPPAKKQQEPVGRPSSKVAGENEDVEFEENNQVRRSPRLRKKQMRQSSAKEIEKGQEEDYVSSDVSDGFRKCFERIIQDSDDCMGPSTSAKKGSSRKQSDAISKSIELLKNYSKPTRSGRRSEGLWEDERDSEEDEGFLGKTSSTSSKKRTYDKRDQTPGSAKSDQTPVGKVARKSRRFGRLDVQSTGSRTPHQGYHSGDDKRTPRLQEAESSPEHNDYNFFSRPPASNLLSRKRKATNDADSGFKSGSSKVETTRQQRKTVASKDDENEFERNANTDAGALNDTSFSTPIDNQSTTPIQPRKLFKNLNAPAAKKRKTESRDNEEDEDLMEDDEFNDVVLISEEVQKTISNLGSEMRKAIKQKKDYVSQMATATMKLITGKSQELWSRQSSKRHALMKEFTKRVNTLIEKNHDLADKRLEVEDNMLSHMRKSLASLATYKKEQEKCLRGIIKTHKAFADTFNSLEDSAESQQVDFQSSLRKELLQYRDQAAVEVQKQEIGNIKRRIQALLTSTSL